MSIALVAHSSLAAKTIYDCNVVKCANIQSANPILPSPAELLWGILAFAVLFFVLRRFGLPPVVKMMHERTERIANDLDTAESARTEAQQTLQDYRRELAEARTEAGRIIEEARQTAERLRQDIMRRADEEAADARQRNADALRAAQDRVLAQVQVQVRELALELAEKVVGANLDRDRNLQLVDSYIAELNASV